MKAFFVCFQNDSKETVYLLLEKLPKIWNEGIPAYPMGWLIDSVIVGDTEDEKNFKWRITGSDRAPLEQFDNMNVEPGDCYLIEMDEEDKWIRFKSYIGRNYTDDLYQEKTSETVYIVYGRDPIYGSDKFVLAKSLPSRWEGDFPIYVDGDCFISYITCDREYEIVEPNDSYPYNPYTWCAAKMVVGGAAVFEKCGKKLELVSNFTSNLHMTRELKRVDTTDHSDCEFAGDIPPCDFMVPVDESDDQPEEDQPAITHGFLVCHKVNGEKRYTLMRNLPVGWTALDSIYYNKSEVIEEVVPGCKYSFVKLNMSAYAYGEAYMMPGDAISCEIIGNRIDYFTKLDRYPVQEVVPGCYIPKDSVIDSDRVVDEVNEAVDQILSDNANKDGAIRPDYYIIETPNGPIECKDVIGYMCYNCGAAVKYVWRAGRKVAEGMSLDDKEINDLEKAITHIAFEIERLGGKVDWSKFTRK